MADEFRALSHRLLHSASSGVPRLHFIREASRMTIEFSGCDLIELWLRENDRYCRCTTTGLPHLSFTFETLHGLPGVDAVSGSVSEAESDLDDLAKEVFLRRVSPSSPCVTRKGSFWTGDSRSPFRCEKKGGDLQATRGYRIGDEHLSIALIPLIAAERTVGLMQLKSKSQDYFTKFEVEFYERVGQNLALALVHQSSQAALRERIKELTCLYGITQISRDPSLPIDKVLERIVNLLPPAWQYTETASATISLDGKRFTTGGFKDGPHRQKADIVVHGGQRGAVEVVYREAMPNLDEGPFLEEERGLIDAVARQVAMIIERRQAAEERILLQDQLRHADRLATIGQLAAGVAHELNEPLGNILGFAQLTQKSPGLPEQARDDVGKIVAACLHARQVIQKLMTFARQEPLQETRVNLNQIVQEGLYFLETRCPKQGIEVIRVLDPDLPEITADSSQLHQILVNLVVNAIQAMPDGGTLTLRTARSADVISLIVEDTGMGMTEDVMKKIFMPFFTTKDVGQGVGLGLAVVHGMVTGHLGTVEVKSKVGEGSRFEVKLPITGPRVGKEVTGDADLEGQ